MFDVPYPSREYGSVSERIEGLYAYLVRLADYLRHEASAAAAAPTVRVISRETGGESAVTPEQSAATFEAIKSLIVTSADVVEAYLEQTERHLAGRYVASSRFGEYERESEQRIAESAARTDALFSELQALTTKISGMESTLVEVDARIRTGLLDRTEDGVPIFGVEIGQRNRVMGEEVFCRFARFTADRLSFFDRNGSEVAYIGDYRLYVSDAEVTGGITLGGYRVERDVGLAFRWEGV